MLNGKFLGRRGGPFCRAPGTRGGRRSGGRESRWPSGWRFAGRPAADETARGIRLIELLQTKHGLSADAAWKYYCLTILNRNELLYLD